MLNNNNIENLPDETWKPVQGFQGVYWVSDKGRVHNNRKVMKFYKINSGYLCIDLRLDGTKKKFLVHRLVAINFLVNVDSHPEVNHVDEDKGNNSLHNLEWCSSSYNKQHSMKSGAYDAIYITRNSLGKKHLPNTTSDYHNVFWDKGRGKWVGTVRHQGTNLEPKRFAEEKDAALHVNYIIDKYELHDRSRNIII